MDHKSKWLVAGGGPGWGAVRLLNGLGFGGWWLLVVGRGVVVAGLGLVLDGLVGCLEACGWLGFVGSWMVGLQVGWAGRRWWAGLAAACLVDGCRLPGACI